MSADGRSSDERYWVRFGSRHSAELYGQQRVTVKSNFFIGCLCCKRQCSSCYGPLGPNNNNYVPRVFNAPPPIVNSTSTAHTSTASAVAAPASTTATSAQEPSRSVNGTQIPVSIVAPLEEKKLPPSAATAIAAAAAAADRTESPPRQRHIYVPIAEGQIDANVWLMTDTDAQALYDECFAPTAQANASTAVTPSASTTSLVSLVSPAASIAIPNGARIATAA